MAAVMFALGVLTIPYFAVDGHCVSPYQLKRVHVGAKAFEVKSILGTPSSVEARGNGSDWLYAGPTWCHVIISFDSEGIVVDIEHDH